MNDVKKVELHLHLDGSIRVETLHELGVSSKVLPQDITLEKVEEMVSIGERDKTLVDYLKKFDLPIAILQTEEALERVSFELVEDLALENTIYAEIRVAPIQHIKKGLTPNLVVESILTGFDRAMEKYDIKVTLLLCAMRHIKEEDNFFLLDLCKRYKKRGVVGLDLAGDEAGFPVTLFKNFFTKAKRENIPFTIHAGEARGCKSIIDAIELGASRLGHGIRAYEDKNALALIKENNICLECCPKSNLDTNAIPNFSEYPIMQYLKDKVEVTLNSDNRRVSNTNFNNEVLLLKKYFEVDSEDILLFNLNAINHAFISDDEKILLRKRLLGDKNGIK